MQRDIVHIIECLREIERYFPRRNFNVRDELTGPILDAILKDRPDILEKRLRSGLVMSFVYRSKIARDFLLAEDNPEYVWEPQTTKLLVQLSREAKNVILGGAYFGDQAVILSKALENNNGSCHCFEVSNEQIGMLARNVSTNKIHSIVINQTALWDRSGIKLSFEGEDALASPREADSSEKGVCMTQSIDDYGEEKGLKTLELIMLDLEGGEFSALKGAQHYLSMSKGSAPNLIFEIHRLYVNWDKGLENTDIVKFLENAGYTLYAIRDYHSNINVDNLPIEIIPINKVYLAGPPHGFNTLAIKDSSLIEKLDLKICNEVSPKLFIHKDEVIHRPLH